MTNGDGYLLIAQVEYASWALNRTLEAIDKLPPQTLTEARGHSCRSILATLQHIFETAWYYFTHLKGESARTEFRDGAVIIPDCDAPDN